MVAQFDGVMFATAQSGLRKLDCGSDLYAAITFSNVPDGRQLLIGWMNNWGYADSVPTDPWRGTMSLPRERFLKTVDANVALVQQAPPEVRTFALFDEGIALDPFDLEGAHAINAPAQCVVDLTVEPAGAVEFGIDLLVGQGQLSRLAYEVQGRRLRLDRAASGETNFAETFGSVVSTPVDLRDGYSGCRSSSTGHRWRPSLRMGPSV